MSKQVLSDIYQTMFAHDQWCPCDSDLRFRECCGPYLRLEESAPSPEALMRSRYVAYVCGDEHYVLHTWHSTTRPLVMNFAEDEATKWTRLNVLDSKMVGRHGHLGTVHF